MNSHTTTEGFYVSPDDFNRVERKVDKCLEAIERLVLIDERQVVQGQRMGQLEQQLVRAETVQQQQVKELWEALKASETRQAEANLQTKQKLDKWINFGLGAWSLAVTLFAIYQAFSK